MDKEQVAERRLAFGRELKKVREARGVSLPGLAQATRIRLDFVEALESGDFAQLPGEVFGRGFVRSIGRTLGGESEELVRQFDEAWGPKVAPQSVLKVEIKNKPSQDPSERYRIKWANALSIIRRGMGFRTILPLTALLVILGLGVVGILRGGAVVLGRLKQGTAQTTVKPASKAFQDTPVIAHAEGKPATTQLASSVPPSDAKTDADPSGFQGAPIAPIVDAKSASEGSPQAASGNATESHRKMAKNANSVAKKPISELKQTESEAASAAHETGANSSVAGEQVLELVVTAPVRIRLDADRQATVTKELSPDTYRFTFGSKADLMVYDAGALTVLFNGKSLGSLGSKGRVRRLSFQAEPLKAEKKM